MNNHSAIKQVTILHIYRWQKLNEYEGSLIILCDDRVYYCYVQLYSGDEWGKYTVGATIDARLYLTRKPGLSIEKLNQNNDSFLSQNESIEYVAVGKIIELKENDRAVIDVGYPLHIDLDTHKDLVSELHVGDTIKIIGILKLDFDLED